MTTDRREIRKAIAGVLDQYSVLCPPEVADRIADAVMPIVKRRQEKKDHQAELRDLAEALATVCAMDLRANNSLLFAEAKRLSQATPEPTPELIKKHYGTPEDNSRLPNWYLDDWRGKQGQLPMPAAIRLTWTRLVGGVGLLHNGIGPRPTVVEVR